MASPALALDPGRLISQYKHTSWSNQNGLPQSAAYALAQSTDGYMWLGTQDGLVRFDGLRFVVFDRSNTPQLPDEWITSLAATRTGAVWGTTSTGLFRIADGVIQVVPVPETPCAVKPSTLWVDHDDSVWVGTRTGTVCQLSNAKWSVAGPAGNQAVVQTIRRTSNGTLWIGTNDGLWKLDKTWRKFTTAEGLPGDRVRALVERKDGSILVGTTKGIGILDRSRILPWRPEEPLFRSFVSSLFEDKHGNLWFGAWPVGLIRVSPSGQISSMGMQNPNKRTPASPAAVSSHVEGTFEDREGNLWIGTAGQGAVVLEDTPIAPFGAAEGLPEDPVWSVSGDRDGTIWISSMIEGVQKVDPDKKGPPVPALLQNRQTGALRQTANGDLWVGIVNGIARLSHGQVTEYRYSASHEGRVVSAIVEDDDGALWVGTLDRGLLRFKDGRFTPDPGFPATRVKTLLRAADGTLWAGGSSNRPYFRKGTTWNTLPAPLPTISLFSILENRSGDLWITGEGGGVHRLRSGKVASIGVAQGLCSASNYAMLDDGAGSYWFTTAKGIAQVSIAELEAVADGKAAKLHCRLLGRAQGMRNPECTGGIGPASAKDQNGHLWFATLRGVVSIDPRKMSRSDFVPLPLLENPNDPMPQDSGTSPALGIRDREFRFTAPVFSNTAALRLQYRLAGYDSNWHDGSQRLARFTNLPPGDYTLHVRATNADGVEGPPASLAKFRIPPQFTETPWFLVAIAAAAAGLLIGGIQFRTRQIRAQQALLESLVAQRTAEARNAARAKSEFLANMSHEIRTPMAATIGATELLWEMDLPLEAREHLATVRASGEALLTLINDILDYSKIDAGKLELERRRFDLIACIDDALALVAVAAQGKDLILEDSIDPEVPGWIEGDPGRLRQILLNLLANAIKFTNVGSIRLSVTLEQASAQDQLLHFCVRDTGIGISPEGMSRLFQEFSQADSSTTRRFGGTGLGLVISKRLTEAFGGRIWAESDPGKGTAFHFTISAGLAPSPPSPASNDRIGLLLADPLTEAGLRRRLERMGRRNLVTLAPTSLPPEPPVQFVFIDDGIAEADAETLRAAHPNAKVIQIASNRNLLPREGLADAVLFTPLPMATLRRLLGDPAPTSAKDEVSAGLLAARIPLAILVAEDNKVNQKVILRMLERLGYQPALAENGLQAVEAVRQRPYGLVFMDVHMPEMDGLEATRRIIAEQPPATRPPIIALTAGAFDENRAECLAAGMSGFITKPVRLAELAAAIEAFAPPASNLYNQE